MAIEIERKFLVIGDSWQKQIESHSEIRQGYLSAHQGVSVRLRVSAYQAWLTIKGPTAGISRAEYEYPIPLQDADDMLSHLVVGAVIHKIRYKVRSGGHLWDLDRFLGDNAGLLVAELELTSENEHFALPDWAGEEVSHDPRYFNSSLVSTPYCQWQETTQ